MISSFKLVCCLVILFQSFVAPMLVFASENRVMEMDEKLIDRADGSRCYSRIVTFNDLGMLEVFAKTYLKHAEHFRRLEREYSALKATLNVSKKADYELRQKVAQKLSDLDEMEFSVKYKAQVLLEEAEAVPETKNMRSSESSIISKAESLADQIIKSGLSHENRDWQIQESCYFPEQKPPGVAHPYPGIQ